MHKITSFEDDMRKFLSQKFWSHGTPLGSLGPLSQGDVHLWFGRPQFLVILGPYSHPDIVACQGQAENPNLTYSLVWNSDYSITSVISSCKFKISDNSHPKPVFIRQNSVASVGGAVSSSCQRRLSKRLHIKVHGSCLGNFRTHIPGHIHCQLGCEW